MPRLAATVVLLRDGREGPEVLLLERRAGSGFAAGAWVFPGGIVDPADQVMPGECRDGATLEDRCAQLRVDRPRALGWHAAAVRETFEEAGLLLATTSEGLPPDLERIGAARVRAGMVAGSLDANDFAAWLAESALVARFDALAPFRRYVTPMSAPRRFDTLFLVGAAPPAQLAVADGAETVADRWRAPSQALEEAKEGSLSLMHPTVRTLESLRHAGSVAEACALATREAKRGIRPILPYRDPAESGPLRLEPGDEGYPMEPYREEFPEWAP